MAPNASGMATPDEPQTEIKVCPLHTNSYVDERSRTFHEDIPIPGTDGLGLHYASSRATDFQQLITIPASGSTVPSNLKKILVRVEVAGRVLEKTLDALPNQTAELIWDGLDHLGKRMSGTTTAHVKTGFVYDLVYYRSSSEFTRSFAQAGSSATAIRGRKETVYWKDSDVTLHCGGATGDVGESWTLSGHHRVDPKDPAILYKADGTLSSGSSTSVTRIINTVAGNGILDHTGDGGPATQASMRSPMGVAADGAGNFYITEGNCVRKVDTKGTITTVAGRTGLWGGYSGDGGPATSALMYGPKGVVPDRSGNLYISDTSNHRVRKVDTSGIITTIAGTGEYGYGGDGESATRAKLYRPHGLALDSQGNLYIADSYNGCIRKVDTGGIITTIAKNANNPSGVAIDAEGNVFYSEFYGDRVSKVDAGGTTTVVAGCQWSSGCDWNSTDGRPAIQNHIGGLFGIALDRAGNLYIADSVHRRIRKVGVDGILTTIAGNGCYGTYGQITGDGGPATQAQISGAYGIGVDARGDVYVASDARVRKVSLLSTASQLASIGELLLPEENGLGQVMDIKTGRHKSTIDLATGKNLQSFQYDDDGRLASVTDRFGEITCIERDGTGKATAITAPNGMRTVLTVDVNGQLGSITYPDGSVYSFEYSSGGLLTAKVDPAGNRFEHRFDSTGRLTDVLDGEGGQWTHSRSSQANGNVITTTLTGEGNRTTYSDSTNSTGAFTSTITDPTGAKTTYSQSADGLTVSKSLACGMNLQNS